MRITWLGHATVLIENEGSRLLTDPVLRDRIGHLIRLAKLTEPAAVGALDGVLVSHLHADHLDLPTLRALRRNGPIIGPPAVLAWLSAHEVEPALALRAGDAVTVGGARVTATPAIHDGRRRPYGRPSEAVGFIIEGAGTVYFAGDTDLFEAMAELRGHVDVALLPVWGWGPRLGPGHLDPERAAAAAALIAPEVAIPIHWGTYTVRPPAKRPADPERPAREFAEHVRRYAPGVEVRILQPGESTEFPLAAGRT